MIRALASAALSRRNNHATAQTLTRGNLRSRDVLFHIADESIDRHLNRMTHFSYHRIHVMLIDIRTFLCVTRPYNRSCSQIREHGRQLGFYPDPTAVVDFVGSLKPSGDQVVRAVIAFLGRGGLLVAHNTGNLVLLAAHYVTGGFGQIGTILSVPVFVLVLSLVTGTFGGKNRRTTLRILLILHALLLAASLALAAVFGPSRMPTQRSQYVAGWLRSRRWQRRAPCTMVKLDLPGFPSTVVLTTNTVQLTIDVATLLRGNTTHDELAKARKRARVTFPSVGGFILGCTAGALLEPHFGLWSL